MFAMAYKDSVYTVVIAVIRWPKCIILVLKPTLMLELRVLLSSSHQPPLLEHSLWLSLAVQLSGKFLIHCHECHCALTLRCRNSPWWRNCESCNIFCLPSGHRCSLDLNSMVVVCRALIGTSCKLATYIIQAAFEQGLSMSWWMPSPPKRSQHQSKTWY